MAASGIASRRKGAPTRSSDTLLGPLEDVVRRDVGHVRMEAGRTGEARVTRLIYPPGFRWSVDMKPVVGSEPVVVIEFDFEGDTSRRLGMPDRHRHA